MNIIEKSVGVQSLLIILYKLQNFETLFEKCDNFAPLESSKLDVQSFKRIELWKIELLGYKNSHIQATSTMNTYPPPILLSIVECKQHRSFKVWQAKNCFSFGVGGRLALRSRREQDE